MTDSNNEFLDLLELETSVKNQDRDECRETESTDDKCYEEYTHAEPEAGVSHLEQSNTSHHSQSSSSTIDSKLKRGQEAISYDEGEAVTSSSDSNKENSAANYDSEGDYESCVMEDTIGDEGYVDINIPNSIHEKDVKRLMRKLRILNIYEASSEEGDSMLTKCQTLIQRDYSCDVIRNYGGALSENYPARLLIPVAEKSETSPDSRFSPNFNPKEYKSKIKSSGKSRLLARFVAPVILFDGKFICRSGSLTVRKTAAFESARQKPPPKYLETTSSTVIQIGRNVAGSMADLSNRTYRAAYQLLVPSAMEEIRTIDAAILKDLNIQHICDLMVEDRKMLKQTISISSSEKINRDIYKDFAIEEMPYPGCEFFAEYNKKEYITNGLVFDWKTPEVNVERQFSVDPYEIFPDVNWVGYKEWDVVELTKNYLKMMLSFLVKDSGGMLIHCISGWDRTPLFISLLRMSLWADGLIHKTLEVTDMAYFTLAYDWYLFGHNLPDRVKEKKEILRFCFDIVASISSDEFSATRMFHGLTAEQQRERSFPKFVKGKRRNLITLSELVLKIYDEEFKKNIPN